jgi:hypothetical protein
MRFTALFLIFISISAHAYEFEGNWNIDKIDCVKAGNFDSSDTATYPYVNCDERTLKVSLGAAKSPDGTEGMNVTFTQYDYLLKYFYKTFVTPDYVTGNLSGRIGDLKISDDGTKLSYKEYKPEPCESPEGSFEYTFELEKVESNKFKLEQHYTEVFNGGKVDNTRTLYLSR